MEEEEGEEEGKGRSGGQRPRARCTPTIASTGAIRRRMDVNIGVFDLLLQLSDNWHGRQD